jgi:hypothetical protein
MLPSPKAGGDSTVILLPGTGNLRKHAGDCGNASTDPFCFISVMEMPMCCYLQQVNCSDILLAKCYRSKDETTRSLQKYLLCPTKSHALFRSAIAKAPAFWLQQVTLNPTSVLNVDGMWEVYCIGFLCQLSFHQTYQFFIIQVWQKG